MTDESQGTTQCNTKRRKGATEVRQNECVSRGHHCRPCIGLHGSDESMHGRAMMTKRISVQSSIYRCRFDPLCPTLVLTLVLDCFLISQCRRLPVLREGNTEKTQGNARGKPWDAENRSIPTPPTYGQTQPSSELYKNRVVRGGHQKPASIAEQMRVKIQMAMLISASNTCWVHVSTLPNIK